MSILKSIAGLLYSNDSKVLVEGDSILVDDVVLDSVGGGSVTLQANSALATNETVEIPSEGVVGKSDKSLCTAWVSFDGTKGTILDSYNVSSIVRTGAGNYDLLFAVAMDNINYAFSSGSGYRVESLMGSIRTINGLHLQSGGGSGSSSVAGIDNAYMTLTFFGGKD